MTNSAWRTIVLAVAVTGVVMIGAMATYVARELPPARTAIVWLGGDIDVQPPGSRASAHAVVEGDKYGWFLWESRGQVMVPGVFESVEGGRRINFDARVGSRYLLSLLVIAGDELRTYQRIWDYDVVPPGPGPPPDPPTPPPLDGLAKQAYDWAADLPANAKSQGKQYGVIFHDAGKVLIDTKETNWEPVLKQEIAGMVEKARAIPLDATWQNVWGPRYAAEMERKWDVGELTSAASVGRAWQEIARGLSVLRTIQIAF